MPHDAAGAATNAARDMQLFALAFTVPATIFPLFLGNALTWSSPSPSSDVGASLRGSLHSVFRPHASRRQRLA